MLFKSILLLTSVPDVVLDSNHFTRTDSAFRNLKVPCNMILLDTKAANEPKNTQEYTSKGIQ